MKLMNVLEPITKDNIEELRPGEWIWDNKRINRPTHYLAMYHNTDGAKFGTFEPIGFRQIHILDVPAIATTKYAFKLSTNLTERAYSWEQFEENRFYKFKWNLLKQLGIKKENITEVK